MSRRGGDDTKTRARRAKLRQSEKKTTSLSDNLASETHVVPLQFAGCESLPVPSSPVPKSPDQILEKKKGCLIFPGESKVRPKPLPFSGPASPPVFPPRFHHQMRISDRLRGRRPSAPGGLLFLLLLPPYSPPASHLAPDAAKLLQFHLFPELSFLLN